MVGHGGPTPSRADSEELGRDAGEEVEEEEGREVPAPSFGVTYVVTNDSNEQFLRLSDYTENPSRSTARNLSRSRSARALSGE